MKCYNCGEDIDPRDDDYLMDGEPWCQNCREPNYVADNHQMSEDQRLDDPRHGQAFYINRGR